MVLDVFAVGCRIHDGAGSQGLARAAFQKSLDRWLDVLVAQVMLQRSRIDTLVCQLAGMAQNMRMDRNGILAASTRRRTSLRKPTDQSLFRR
jgi:hypothetical protein